MTIGADFSLGLSMPFHNLADLPTLILLLIICIPFLLSAGLLKDLNNAFGIALGRKNDIGLNEIKRAAEAVTLTISTLLGSGFLIFLMSMITILHSIDTPASLGPKISVAILGFIYSCVFALLLLPLKSILNLRIIEYMSKPTATAINAMQEKALNEKPVAAEEKNTQISTGNNKI